MTSYSVKLKSKNGQHILSELSSSTKVHVLKSKVAQITNIKEYCIHILTGFPPSPIDISDGEKTITDVGIKKGETLIIEEKVPASLSNNSFNINPSLEADEALARRLQAEEDDEQLRKALSEASSGGSTFSRRPASSGVPYPTGTANLLPVIRAQLQNSGANYNGILLKKVVPADNSCLFTSIRFVLHGEADNEGSEMMRHIIAQEVAANPIQFNDAVLGKSNAEYCTWIQRPESWGGAIEVSILSMYYGIEIDVVDIQNTIINRFGEDKNYSFRVFLLFDGIHYDALYMDTGRSGPTTIFPVEENQVYEQAEQLANKAKSARQYTNVDKFTLRCQQCDAKLIGQVQAQQHAMATGHTSFGEI